MARFLALDWDQNQLHLVAATIRGHTVKVQRAVLWQEERSPNATEAEELGRLLRERLKEAGIAPAPVLACLARDRVILKDVRYPAVPEPEEPALVRFQAVKELTDAPEDVVIDYVPPAERRDSGEQRALAVVLRRDLLATYQTLCQAAGLKLVGLTPRPFGLAACLRKVMGTTALTPPPEPAGAAVAVVVLAERWAEFCVLQGETLLMTRSLTLGAGLAAEVRRNLAIHAGQAPHQAVRALYLAGSGSGELRERLADLDDLPVHTFDPFAGADSPGVPAGNRGSFAGAVGLLQARAEPRGLPINFIQPRQPAPPKARVPRWALAAGLVAALFFPALIVLEATFEVFSGSARTQLRLLESERDDKEQQVKDAQADAKLIEELDKWDTVVTIDELYDLAARIPDVNALRVDQLMIDPLTRTTKSPYAARITIKGTLLDSGKGREPVDQLISAFGKDGYYSPEAPKITGDRFTLTVNVERRAPREYRRVIKPPPPKEEPRGEPEGNGT